MCKKNTPTKRKQNQLSLLLTSSSFHCTDEKDEKGPLPPSKKSIVLTLAVCVGILTLHEQFHRYLITNHLMSLHPILEIERHRHIIARHIGVDAFACLTIAIIGFLNRHLLVDVLTFDRKKVEETHLARIYTYQPEAHRVLLFFLAYQVKNTHDSWVWNDGYIFIAHHLFAGLTAWYGMYPGIASVYGLFFMGLSEISTCVLCLLANFDDQFGVVGLDEAFPKMKIFLGIAFVILFIIYRVILWPIFAYHFLMDSISVLKRDSVRETKEVKFALKMMVGSCVGLTFLQILWLGEIIVVAKTEISALL